MHRRLLMQIFSIGLLFAFANSIAAADVQYERDVKSVLKARCFACHGALKQEANLRLDTAASMKKGGDSGPAVVPGNAEKSLIVQVATGDAGFRMPPEEEGAPLSKKEIALLKAWVTQGATAPQNEKPESDPREHWSYQVPKKPSVPVVKNQKWVRNPIDAFISAKHEEHGLKPQSQADKSVLLRRLYLDLIGLPPTRDQLLAFLQDDSADAYEQVVDRLLNSPQYGERWGRHWMDVWRYSDWYGRRGQNEIRYGQRHIWRWRDWIIESLNADKGYNRMIVEMLAGDEIAPADTNVVRATGFIGRNWYKFNRNVWLFETVEQTCRGMLALKMRCARCHDHKYDPVSQQEYYQFQAYFAPQGVRTDPVTAATKTETDNGKTKVLSEGLSRVFDETLDAKTYRFVRGDDRKPDKEHPLTPAVPAVFGPTQPKVQSIPMPVESYYPALQPQMVQQMLAAAKAEIETAVKTSAAARQKLANTQNKLKLLVEGKQQSQPDDHNLARIFLNDDFTKSQPDVWQVLSGNWDYQEQFLAQTQVGNFLTMVTKQNHPADFRARIRYKTTEPTSVTSIGASFDVTENLRDWQAVYTHTKGTPAVHAFYRKMGKDTYPSKAIINSDLQLGEMITLDLAVRGNQLNVWVDGELKIAYRMPLPRQKGKFALWCHGSTAEFHQLLIDKLPEDFSLAKQATENIHSPFTKPTNEDLKKSLAAAQFAVEQADRKRMVLNANLVSIQARIAADRARVNQAADQAQLATAAAKAEKQAELLKREHELLAVKHELATAKANTKLNKQKKQKAIKAAEKKLAATQKKFDASKKAAQTESQKFTPLGKEYPKTSSGRRLALAKWMTSPTNPRTARVCVNHIWLRHFGEAIVPTVDNFGPSGKPASHPNLLDWLAAELIEQNWSMKHLHRLIVNSNTYRMSSRSQGRMESAKRDLENRFYWRRMPQRMEAEVVRDSLLALSGQLDGTMGGPDLDEKLGLTSRRRSLYFRITPDNKMQMLELFDLANPNECYRRQKSIVPQQALALANSALALDQSRLLARNYPQSLGETEFINQVFEHVLTRTPSDEEHAACRKFLKENAELLTNPRSLKTFPAAGAGSKVAPASDPVLRARENLVHVLINHNDFVTIR